MEDEQTIDEVVEPSSDTPDEQIENHDEPGTEPDLEEEPQTEEVEPPAPEERPPSRRESLRIAKLVKDELSRRQTEPQFTPPKGLDYGQALDADPETIRQLEADRLAYAKQAQAQTQAQLGSMQFHTRLELDAPKIEAKYPKLNAQAPEFNPVMADAINNWYLASVGYDTTTGTVQNPNVRYSDFVEGIMELADEIAGDKVTRTTQNIARQAANTGLRPDGGSSKRLNLNKAPENMSDEELDAVIALGIPSTKR